jgi:hypothetical protein
LPDSTIDNLIRRDKSGQWFAAALFLSFWKGSEVVQKDCQDLLLREVLGVLDSQGHIR